MRTHWLLRGLKFVVFAALFVAVSGLIVMRLWNWLTPGLFGWHVITFWQAVGILILSKILLGGFRGRPGMASLLAPPDDGALGTNDARGAREIPRGHARGLRTVRAHIGGNQGLRPFDDGP